MATINLVLFIFGFVLLILEAGGASWRSWHPGWLGLALWILTNITPALGQ